MKFLDQLNEEMEQLANQYAAGNAYGIPVAGKDGFKFANLHHLPTIKLNEHTPSFLRRLAEILEKYV